MAQNTHAGTEVSGEGGNFPAFDTTHFGGQLLWLAITFGLLYFMVSKVIVPRFKSIFEEREGILNRDLQQAQEARVKAEEAGKAYERSLAEARSNAQNLAQEAHSKLTAESEKRRKALEEELAVRMQEANSKIEKTKTKAMKNVRAIAAETTSTLVEHIIEKAPSDTAVEAALDQIKA
ncbi:F0F1 ATP synthase subunit B' [Microvirga sp. W0021]|uniref:ATP synthase subunit b n=1 Tax=Hohaiivirga grylli TaxID=3133970 RepID=A0ABV0BHJ6_9HYPH